ncbi:hypothetical protein NSK_002795 [Nannochloropsis salina CCMP1776]|jgi:hypothetical protein|uniref:Uncharacterized protein n=1 Tax=Nannochloropsis salina CCMP1776 TaxID=1027361 RepID=A0A4D9D920_9STRA|nr:hypothetical protein NSK_002795 [Nannochloropsis salina CCMP1776]|eukprot:TFJ85975.1 hypothetical protein NSK_002795 [Nannochloropsis salina CCMP1776]
MVTHNRCNYDQGWEETGSAVRESEASEPSIPLGLPPLAQPNNLQYAHSLRAIHNTLPSPPHHNRAHEHTRSAGHTQPGVGPALATTQAGGALRALEESGHQVASNLPGEGQHKMEKTPAGGQAHRMTGLALGLRGMRGLRCYA